MNAGILGVASDFETVAIAFLDERDNDLLCGAGVGGAFEDYKLAFVELWGNGFDRAGDVAEVGLMVFVERSGDADDDHVHVGDFGIVGGGAEAGVPGFLDGRRKDTNDVGAAAVERVNLALLDIEASNLEGFAAEKERERQADVPHTDDTDAGLARFDFLLQVGEGNVGCGGHIDDCKGRMACAGQDDVIKYITIDTRRYGLRTDSTWGEKVAKYLVTGAAGFIGRSIAAALLKRGELVRGIDSFITGQKSNLAGLEGMEFIEGDLTDTEDCARACEGVEVVFHEAALASVPRSVADPASTNLHCVTATLNLLVAARGAGVRRVVYAGSSSAYGDTPTLPKDESMLPKPISPYAVAKLAGEQYMQAFTRVYGLETVTLRYFNVFGPFQDPTSHYSGVLAIFCRRMLAGEQPTIYGDGEQSRDFTYIENVVHGNLLAADAPAEKVAGQMMNLATGARTTLNDTFRILRDLTGYTGEPAYAESRPGDIRDSLADIGLAEKLLGYKPVVNFREGLRRTVEWYRSSLDA